MSNEVSNEYREINELIREINRKGFDEGYKRGRKDNPSNMKLEFRYNDGLNDAWKVARKIFLPSIDGGLNGNELCLIFETADTAKIIRKYTASEAIAKIKEYEKQKSFGYDAYKDIKETVKSMIDKGYTISMLQTVVEQNFKQEGAE